VHLLVYTVVIKNLKLLKFTLTFIFVCKITSIQGIIIQNEIYSYTVNKILNLYLRFYDNILFELLVYRRQNILTSIFLVFLYQTTLPVQIFKIMLYNYAVSY
jgi:hypothetical protein